MSDFNIIDNDLVSEVKPELNDASKNQRLVNYLIDLVAIIALSVLLGVVLALTGNESWIENKIQERVWGFVITFLYYFICEGFTSRTLGKLFTKTRTVDEEGNPLSWGLAAKRSLSRIVPFEQFSFLGGGTGWHDAWTDTRVVAND